MEEISNKSADFSLYLSVYLYFHGYLLPQQTVVRFRYDLLTVEISAKKNPVVCSNASHLWSRVVLKIKFGSKDKPFNKTFTTLVILTE